MGSTNLRSRACGTLVALLAAALLGCASMLPKLEPPRLSVVAVTMVGGNLSQQQIQLTLHAVNPNQRAIDVTGIDCDVELSGKAFAHGTTEAGFRLPPQGETDFTFDVTANLNTALAALAGSLSHSTVDYRLYGQVRVKGSIVRAINFDQSGRVRL